MTNINRNIAVRTGEYNGYNTHVVSVEEIAEALEKYYSEVGTGVKCPFFNKPCLMENCTAFQYNSELIGYEDERYKNFPRKFIKMDGHELLEAYKIPFCRVLKKELPMKVDSEVNGDDSI